MEKTLLCEIALAILTFIALKQNFDNLTNQKPLQTLVNVTISLIAAHITKLVSKLLSVSNSV